MYYKQITQRRYILSNKPKRKRKKHPVHEAVTPVSPALLGAPVPANVPNAQDLPNMPDNPMVTRLKANPVVDVVITNTEPEALVFVTPILRKMVNEYKSVITVHVTTPANPTYIDLIERLDTVQKVMVHQQIDQKVIEKLEKKSNNVIMFNYLAALQQTLARGLHASQGIAALTQIVLNPIDALNLEVALSKPAKAAAKTIYGKDYVLLCPEFIAAIDPNYCTQRIWNRNKWLEVASWLAEDCGKDVIILSFENGMEPVLPQGVYDKIVSVVSCDVEEVAAIISNASLVMGIDAGFVQIARALNKSILHIHSGGPVSWSASIYPHEDVRDGTTRVLAAIDINVITVEDVKQAYAELIGEKCVADISAHETLSDEVQPIDGC